MVSISGTPSVAEGGNLVYTVSLSGGTSATPIVVPVTYTGTAANGTDYTNVVNVTIPAGASSASLTVAALADSVLEGSETVIATLGAGTGYTVGTASATGTITDVAPPLVVSISGTPSVAEGGNLVYTVSLSGGTSATPIVVPVTYTGTAANGTDYTNVVNVTIPAGASSASLTVAALADSVLEGSETVIATLGAGTGYTVGTASATGTITDVAPPLVVSISGTPSVAEGGNLVYTVSLSGGTSATPIVVPVTYTGTAANGTDYTNVVNVTIPAGASSASLTVAALTDSVLEGSETVIATLGAGTGYTVGTASATGTITDVAPPLVVSISGTPSVAEGGNLVYTVSLSGGTSATPIVVPVTYTGTAANGTDYTNVVNVTIPAGASSASLTVAALTDSVLEGSETVIATLGAGTGYTVAPPPAPPAPSPTWRRP